MQIKSVLLIVFAMVLNVLCTQAQDTLFITNDSLLPTTGPQLWFEGDTTVVFNKKREAVEGNLLKSTYLWTGRRLILFGAGHRLKLNNEGNVVDGSMVEHTLLWTGKQALVFKKNVSTCFNHLGFVVKGQLFKDQELIVREEKILFLKDHTVAFDDDGNVLEGSIAKREQLLNTNGKTKGYKANSHLFFNEKTEVIHEGKKRRNRKNKKTNQEE